MSWRPVRPPLSPEKGRLFRDSLLFLLLVLMGYGCAAHRTSPATQPAEPVIEGKVSLGGKGVTGAEVFLLTPQFFLPPHQAPVAVAESTEAGDFRLRPGDPGSYLLLARQDGRFAYFGRNPILVRGPVSGVNLPLVPAHPTRFADVAPGEEALSGQVLHEGHPVPGARVFVYLDPSRGFRGPGYAISEPTDRRGEFRIPLPPGTYFAVARLRQEGWKPGALEPGDLFGVLPDFPIQLHKGQRAAVVIETLTVPSEDQMARYRKDAALLSGRIVDQKGRPLAGMRACLYDNPQMLNRPLTLSEPTGADGRFTLTIDRGGTFFLGARQRLGGPPGLGETIGFYRGDHGSRVELTPGDRLEDLTIVVQGIP